MLIFSLFGKVVLSMDVIFGFIEQMLIYIASGASVIDVINKIIAYWGL